MATSPADSPLPVDPAEAVRQKQQQDAQRLLNRLQQIEVHDLVIHYSLEQSRVTVPAAMICFLVMAVLFRLDSMKKWHLVLSHNLLPEPVRKWLAIESLADMIDQATAPICGSG